MPKTNTLFSEKHKWTCGKSRHGSSWHFMNCGTKHFFTCPNICIEACVVPEHLCPIWITSMTPVQMVTGCDRLVSPVPIHLPVNRSFDTLRLFFFGPMRLTWLPPFWNEHKQKGIRWIITPHPHPPKVAKMSKTNTSYQNFWPICGSPWLRLIELFWNLNVRLPFFMAPLNC